MAINKLVVHYDGTDRGRIYLGDVGQRHQLGGGQGLYNIGQDRYISPGDDATFIQTGDVLMSAYAGRIKKYEDLGSFTIDFATIGITGAIGATGVRGATGIQGMTGIRGLTGLIGATGAA